LGCRLKSSLLVIFERLLNFRLGIHHKGNLPGSFPFNVLPTTGENMTFVTVVVITALCFVFASTRKYGVIGTGLLL